MAAHQDANAYIYENVGVGSDAAAARSGNAYIYENVVEFYAQDPLVPVSRLLRNVGTDQWDITVVRRWNGSQWVKPAMYRYDGSAWVLVETG